MSDETLLRLSRSARPADGAKPLRALVKGRAPLVRGSDLLGELEVLLRATVPPDGGAQVRPAAKIARL